MKILFLKQTTETHDSIYYGSVSVSLEYVNKSQVSLSLAFLSSCNHCWTQNIKVLFPSRPVILEILLWLMSSVFRSGVFSSISGTSFKLFPDKSSRDRDGTVILRSWTIKSLSPGSSTCKECIIVKWCLGSFKCCQVHWLQIFQDVSRKWHFFSGIKLRYGIQILILLAQNFK